MCSRQIYCVLACCVLISPPLNFLRRRRISCAPVKFLAFRWNFLRPSNFFRYGRISCVSVEFLAPVKFLAFRWNFLCPSNFLRFGGISCALCCGLRAMPDRLRPRGDLSPRACLCMCVFCPVCLTHLCACTVLLTSTSMRMAQAR